MRDVTKMQLYTGLGILGLMMMLACGQEAEKTSTKTKAGAAAGGDDLATDEDGIGGKSTKDPVAAAKLWIDTVKPALEEDCSSCHAEPRFTVPSRGPLTIFSYDSVKKMMADGTSAIDNKMMRKVLGEDTHGGGARCKVTEEPCSFLVQLHKLEFGSGDGDGATGDGDFSLPADADPRASAIVSVSTGGLVIGWAVDKQNLRNTVGIKLVLDAKIGTGTVIATTVAEKLGDDGKHPGDHGFFVQVPEQYRTGVERDLYIYDDKDQLLSPTPFKFKAYAPTAAGRAFFNSTVAPKIEAKCANCHQATYETFYAALSGKGPNEGGTASNNNAVNKPGGVESHNGGNRCGGINGSPCAEFQQWWPLEFGQ